MVSRIVGDLFGTYQASLTGATHFYQALRNSSRDPFACAKSCRVPLVVSNEETVKPSLGMCEDHPASVSVHVSHCRCEASNRGSLIRTRISFRYIRRVVRTASITIAF